MLLKTICSKTNASPPTQFPNIIIHPSYFAKLILTVMTVGVQAALNTPPPAPLRTLTPPWGTAGALRALLRPWTRAPCAPQGPHVQLAGGRGCHHPGVRGEAGRQQWWDEQEDWDDRADHGRPRHPRRHSGPLLAPTSHLRLHDPAPKIWQHWQEERGGRGAGRWNTDSRSRGRGGREDKNGVGREAKWVNRNRMLG